MRGLIIGTVSAAFAALFFVAGSLPDQSARAQEKAARVRYGAIPAGDYKIDPAHSTVGFSVRHYEINWVEGRFKDFNGTIRYDSADITKSSVEFTARVESIDTGVAARDTHLRGPDFFDVAKHPTMSFKSTRVERKGKDGYLLHGDFTLKGVTRPVAIPFTISGAITDARGNLRFGVEGHTKIDRRDYGMTYGKALEIGGFDIGNEVKINLYLEALKAAPGPAGQ